MEKRQQRKPKKKNTEESREKQSTEELKYIIDININRKVFNLNTLKNEQV